MRKVFSLDVFLWLALAAMWGSSYSVIKIGISTIDPTVLVAGRLLVGAGAIFAVLKIRRMSLSKKLNDWIAYSITGLLGSALPFLLITYGEQTVDSALASILMGMVPITTVLLATLMIPDEHLTPRIAFAVGGGLVGIIILTGPSVLLGLGGNFIGQAAIIAATFSYAASTVYIRKFVTRPPLEMAAGSMIVGTICMFGALLISRAEITSIELTFSSLGALLYLGVFSTACANLIYFYLVPRLGATRMSQVNFAVPMMGVLLGVLLLQEAFTFQQLIALVIIIGSVYLGTTKPKTHIGER